MALLKEKKMPRNKYYNGKRSRHHDTRTRSLLPDAPPPPMSKTLEDRLKALEGLIADPFNSPVRIGSYDGNSIFRLLQIVRERKLTRYWLNLVAVLYASYREQGYIWDGRTIWDTVEEEERWRSAGPESR